MSELNPMSGETLDLTKENIEKLKELFPEALSEDQIDFEKLRLILGDEVNDKPEKYSFTWNGKQNAIKLAQQSSTGTLRPNKEKSKNWDTTENLYIEGDNLEVLKLLQKSYANKIDMIYIDPPYNTGNDFVYRDDYRDNIQNYFEQTDQVDSEGNKLSTNTESSGRFHTDWLNMIYPRLILAKHLLTDNGVIFISIDEHEHAQLKLLCDDIFGEMNLIADFIWQKKQGGGNDSVHVATEHEYILLYARDRKALPPFFGEYEESYLKRYKEEDEIGRFYWDTFKRKSGKQYFPITAPDGTVLQYDENGNEISWLRSQARFYKDLEEGEIRFVKGADGWSVHFKQRLPKGKKPRSIITTKGTTASGNEELLKIFKKDFFDNPKPTKLIQHLLSMTDNKNAKVLDFFAGSSTTAHATMELNAEDNGKRKFIMVQLPEPLSKTNIAYKDGYENISEISQERIRRAGEKILNESNLSSSELDIGFKVFELEKSNIQKWNVDSENIEESLFAMQNNFVEGRSHADIVYEVLLKLGLDLNTLFEESKINESTVYDIALGNVYVVLGENITQEVANYLADKQKEYENENPSVVFNDNGFVSDNEKLNSIEILKNNGFNEEQLMSI